MDRPSSATSAAPATPAPSPSDPAACAALLKQHFPKLFDGPVRPLKLRIQADIQARAPGVFSKPMLSAFLRRHTGSTTYLSAIAKATHRTDLDGEPAGEVSAEHRQVALDELARRRANQASRRDLEQQQRRNRATLLRDFGTTTLTAANFCALKGVPPDELDGLLARARAEADEDRSGASHRSAPASHRSRPAQHPTAPGEAPRPRRPGRRRRRRERDFSGASAANG